MWEAIARLAPLAPGFVSVTYGAGGSTRERTHATRRAYPAETDIMPAAHLTCVAATRDEVDEVVRGYWDVGRAPYRGAARRSAGRDRRRLCPDARRLRPSTELVAGLRAIGDFEISVSAYPEKHPESAVIEPTSTC